MSSAGGAAARASLAVLLLAAAGCGGGGQQSTKTASRPTASEPEKSSKPKAAEEPRKSAAFQPFAKEGPEVMNTGPAKGSKGEAGGGAGTWSIVIVAASGDEADGLAGAALQKVRTQGGLPDAYMERRGKSVVVAYGRYTTPADPVAQQDLQRIQAIEVEGSKPFIGAVMVPPSYEALSGSIPEYNLANVKKERGKDALYTLQMAVYTVPPPAIPKASDLAEFRKRAEEAVVNLRREGEEAFYYHGRNSSMVTVGVFGKKDLDVSKPGQESFALSEMRRKYPFNLVNGAQYLVKTKGSIKAAQPSFVVPIPD